MKLRESPVFSKRPEWDWGAFQGTASQVPSEDVQKLAELGIRSLVVSENRLAEYLPVLGNGMRLATIVFFLRDTLNGKISLAETAKRLRRVLETAGEHDADGVIVIRGMEEAAPNKEQWNKILEELIKAAALPPGSPHLIFEPMVPRAEDLFVFPDEARSFAKDSLAGISTKLIFDTYHIAALGLDIMTEWERQNDWVGHIHLSDFIPGAAPDKERVLPGAGTLPFKELLDRIGPRCGVSLVLEAWGPGRSMEKSMKYLHECVRDIELSIIKP